MLSYLTLLISSPTIILISLSVTPTTAQVQRFTVTPPETLNVTQVWLDIPEY